MIVMYVQQNVSILFFLRKVKTNSSGLCPIYCRLTIDGLREEFSTGVKICANAWDGDLRQVSTDDANHKVHNKRLRKIVTDLDRLIDLIQAKDEIATPSKVLGAYKAPAKTLKNREEKELNLAFSKSIDEAIGKCLEYNNRYNKATLDGKVPPPLLESRLTREWEAIRDSIEALAKEGKAKFDDKTWEKTLVMAIDEHLLNFMEITFAGHRSPNTLEKMWGRKKRYVDFLEYRYEKSDLPLCELQFKFMDELLKYNMVQHGIQQNSAMKYVQILKGILSRAESLGWMSARIFDEYSCKYTDPHTDWLTMAEMLDLIPTDFGDSHINLVKDIFVFQSFTGLAYADLRSLGPEDLREGMDGKLWISKFRQKTDGDETLPLLPTALRILEKYKDHPISLKRCKVLPVPCNVDYNRSLKVIASTKGYKINLRSHKARYFFANVVMFDNGVGLKTIAATLGQRTTRSTEKYVRANKSVISRTMMDVEEKLYGAGGSMAEPFPVKGNAGKIIALKRK